MAKNIFEQTNRTILFEEFNGEKLDLLTLVGSGNNVSSLDDEKIREIHEHLLVKSFPEFLEKFEPKIYSFFNAASQKIAYSLEKPQGIPENAITEIPITVDNTFFKMLSTLLESKRINGSKNVDFDFANILNFISPKKVMDDIKQQRKEIAYTYDKYEALEDEDPTKLEYGDKLNVLIDKASKNYNNILGMVPLAIEDIKTRIMIGSSDSNGKSEEIKIGMLTMSDKGELKIIEKAKEESTALAITTNKNSEALAECFEEDYDAVSEEKNEYIKNLVVRTFVPLPVTLEDIDVEQEVANYNQYLAFYKDAQEDFIKTLKPLMEKILGVKVFFEQYDKELSGMKPSLLITNIKLEMLLKGENKQALELYLNTVNQKNDFENTVWFGIVPSINLEEQVNNKNIRQRFKGTNKAEKVNYNTLENLGLLMSILSKYRILTFFSMIGSEETTFNNLATTGVMKYIDKTKNLQYKKGTSEYLVPALPSFTVVPREKSAVILDHKMKISESGLPEFEKEELIKFWIEGIYIEGAYVAAGITAAYQCPEYLRKRFKKVDPNEPGVRINIEDRDNAFQIVTTMSKEITGYTTATKDSINRNNFGFVFSSDNVQYNGQVINNITVYKARTLDTNEEGTFEPIYKTVTSTYIERILRYLSTDFKEDKVKDFFSTNPNSQKNKWLKSKENGNVNAILQPGDDLSMVIDGNSCLLHIIFNGDVKNLTLEITKN
ncbi:transcriptional regulator [Fusobacterium sp.]|uniref:transcriptional regulator n=1 Tax=Fusobacterium sp. TaxID=68766 RepID=UPI0025B86ED4|nr:transcriptional regulator [Fusobacterium sp.]